VAQKKWKLQSKAEQEEDMKQKGTFEFPVVTCEKAPKGNQSSGLKEGTLREECEVAQR
jgi:hypothetical protein